MDAPDSEADLIDLQEAAAVIGVPAEQVEIMVQDGMLTAASEAGGEPLFRRAEAEAVRLAGG